MSVEKPVRYIIFGAGAIGSAVAGLLARAGRQVRLVARPAQAAALRRGIIIKQQDEEIRLSSDAVTSARALDPQPGDVVILTTKSQATETAIEELAEVYDRSAPVVCLQNGVRNEEIAARRFQNIYAGLVFFSAVQLDPHLITLPRGRTITIGRFPDEVDRAADQICRDLAEAGFEASVSSHVMAMKWGKLIANLNNATHAITGYWLERGMADTEMRSLMLEVRLEGLRVLDASRIAAEPPPGEPSPIRIRQMTEALGRPAQPAGPSDLPEHMRTYASMWQDLHLGRKTNEAQFLNGEIVALGDRCGIPTPYNSTLLDIINRMAAQATGPGIYSPAELHSLIRERAKSR